MKNNPEWLILNGNPNKSRFDSYLDDLQEQLKAAGVQVQQYNVRDLNIKQCLGCWNCWLKTPGLCVIKDDMELIYPLLARVDLVLWASPLILGTISGILKQTQDRFIPMIHPYIEVVDGECHHKFRYAHNPDLGLLVEKSPADTHDDVALTELLFQRFSRNTRTPLRFCADTETPAKELIQYAASHS